jgi:hypothetical protein
LHELLPMRACAPHPPPPMQVRIEDLEEELTSIRAKADLGRVDGVIAAEVDKARAAAEAQAGIEVAGLKARIK